MTFFSRFLHRLSSSPLISQYNALLTSHPLTTKCLTSGGIGLLGDSVSQLSSEDKYNSKRAWNFLLLQTFLVGPALHFWYGALFTFIPGAGVANLLKRVALDQMFFSPVFLATFISANFFFDDKTKQIPQKLRNDLLPTYIANISLWVPSQFINFGLVAPKFQVFFANMVGLVWNIYLSGAANKQIQQQEEEQCEAVAK